MSAPFVFITTHTLNDGRLDEYMEQHGAFGDFLEASEPALIDFQVFINEGIT